MEILLSITSAESLSIVVATTSNAHKIFYILPRAGIEPTFPRPQRGALTTGLPGPTPPQDTTDTYARTRTHSVQGPSRQFSNNVYKWIDCSICLIVRFAASATPHLVECVLLQQHLHISHPNPNQTHNYFITFIRKILSTERTRK